MRRQDIKVGEEYAYKVHKWATPMRVKVLSTDATKKQGRYYSTRTVAAIEIELLEGSAAGQTRTVTGVNIDRPWAEQVEINEANDRRRTLRREQELAAIEKKWSNLAVVSNLFEEAGSPSRSYSIDEDNAQAAERHGFEVARTQEVLYSYNERTYEVRRVVLYGVDDDGDVKAADLADAVRSGGVKVVD
jgi:hypothetical protein